MYPVTQLCITFLFTLLTLIPHISAFAIRNPLPTPTLSSPQSPYKIQVPVAELTQGPSSNALELKRQASDNYCTEWSLLDGGSVYCSAPATCLFKYTNGFAMEWCGVTSSLYTVAVDCYDYTNYIGVPPVSTIHCPSTVPYCGIYQFISGLGLTYTNYGCATTPYSHVAVITADATSPGTTPTTSPIPTPKTTPTPSSTTSPSPTPTSTTTTPIPQPANTTPPSSGGINTAAAIGGAVGGFATLVLMILGIIKCVRNII